MKAQEGGVLLQRGKPASDEVASQRGNSDVQQVAEKDLLEKLKNYILGKNSILERVFVESGVLLDQIKGPLEEIVYPLDLQARADLVTKLSDMFKQIKDQYQGKKGVLGRRDKVQAFIQQTFTPLTQPKDRNWKDCILQADRAQMRGEAKDPAVVKQVVKVKRLKLTSPLSANKPLEAKDRGRFPEQKSNDPSVVVEAGSTFFKVPPRAGFEEQEVFEKVTEDAARVVTIEKPGRKITVVGVGDGVMLGSHNTKEGNYKTARASDVGVKHITSLVAAQLVKEGNVSNLASELEWMVQKASDQINVKNQNRQASSEPVPSTTLLLAVTVANEEEKKTSIITASIGDCMLAEFNFTTQKLSTFAPAINFNNSPVGIPGYYEDKSEVGPLVQISHYDHEKGGKDIAFVAMSDGGFDPLPTEKEDEEKRPGKNRVRRKTYLNVEVVSALLTAEGPIHTIDQLKERFHAMVIQQLEKERSGGLGGDDYTLVVWGATNERVEAKEGAAGQRAVGQAGRGEGAVAAAAPAAVPPVGGQAPLKQAEVKEEGKEKDRERERSRQDEVKAPATVKEGGGEPAASISPQGSGDEDKRLEVAIRANDNKAIAEAVAAGAKIHDSHVWMAIRGTELDKTTSDKVGEKNLARALGALIIGGVVLSDTQRKDIGEKRHPLLSRYGLEKKPVLLPLEEEKGILERDKRARKAREEAPRDINFKQDRDDRQFYKPDEVKALPLAESRSVPKPIEAYSVKSRDILMLAIIGTLLKLSLKTKHPLLAEGERLNIHGHVFKTLAESFRSTLDGIEGYLATHKGKPNEAIGQELTNMAGNEDQEIEVVRGAFEEDFRQSDILRQVREAAAAGKEEGKGKGDKGRPKEKESFAAQVGGSNKNGGAKKRSGDGDIEKLKQCFALAN